MPDRLKEKTRPDEPRLAREVGTKAERKLRAQRHLDRTIWLGLGMMGLIGWSVAIPTLAGVALGLWLDKYHPAELFLDTLDANRRSVYRLLERMALGSQGTSGTERGTGG